MTVNKAKMHDDCLKLCLCIEELDSCDILINQIANGSVFGVTQPFHLMLQGTDLYQLEDLRMEICDCAFPLIRDVSVHTTFHDVQQTPDIILILLSSRSSSYTTSPSVKFQDLFSLVSYMLKLSEFISSMPLQSTKLFVTGDLSLTAAAILNHKLQQTLTATQLLAIDGHMGRQLQHEITKAATESRGQYSKFNQICDILKQWWTGARETLKPTNLGSKFWSTSRYSKQKTNSGYFFSSPVEMDGPMKFITPSNLHPDSQHITEVKATTDKAFTLLNGLDGQCNKFNNTSRDGHTLINLVSAQL